MIPSSDREVPPNGMGPQVAPQSTYVLPIVYPCPYPLGGRGGRGRAASYIYIYIHIYIYTYIYIYIYIYAYIEENQPYNGYQGPSLILGLRHQV